MLCFRVYRLFYAFYFFTEVEYIQSTQILSKQLSDFYSRLCPSNEHQALDRYQQPGGPLMPLLS